MTTPDIGKLLVDSLPSFIGGFFGALIAHMFTRGYPDVRRLRRHLGRALDRFRDVPSDRLDSALIAAAQAAQQGWRSAGFVLAWTFVLGTGMFSSKVFRATFPTLPGWLEYVACALVAALLAWPFAALHRRVILRR